MEYRSCTLEWRRHPWADGIDEPTLHTPAMPAAASGLIFWRCDKSSSLLLDTSTMTFSTVPLPAPLAILWDHPLRSRPVYAIGDTQAGECCLVSNIGRAMFQVWLLKKKNNNTGHAWELEKQGQIGEVDSFNRQLRVHMVAAGLALVFCMAGKYSHIIIDLKNMSLKDKFLCHRSMAYPFQMPWPPAALVASSTSERSKHQTYACGACLVVANGRRCDVKVTRRNGDGLWYCGIRKWRFGSCNYRYSVLLTSMITRMGLTRAVAFQEEMLGIVEYGKGYVASTLGDVYWKGPYSTDYVLVGDAAAAEIHAVRDAYLRVTHLKLDVEMVELEYGMEFEYLFGVPDEIPDITRSSGMVRRIRFIYRMSFYVNKMSRKVLWKVLEDMASPINFNQFLEKEKLKSNGSNFTDWFRHVRIFLNGGNLQYVLDAPLGDPPAETETDEVKNVYATRKTRYSQVQCAILCSLESDLQKRFEHHDPHELMKELKTIFETHAAVECYEASKHFFSCMMEEGSSISEHMLVMTGHAKKLSDLGIVIPNRLGINRVLQSLPPSYKNFVMNYNMQNMNKEFPELFGMLKAAEIEIKKEHQVLMVNKTTGFKKQGKSKGKFKKGGKKAATPPMKPKNGPKPI
ncbi:hypothetical protein QYE76_009164 [Lolium multiflorum]|uniref:Uncharacterized protein n=1 Tax=Lolium multiflorum TaxID=4521 RepID=A0AAD8TT44_LOLMU|nr:hypothetical protein QYE76_009164 [Lolium multiflorum]